MDSQRQEVLKIWDKHHATLDSMALGLTNNTNFSADDLLQELTFKMLKNCKTVVTGYRKSKVGYLKTMLKNIFIDMLRKEKTARTAVDIFLQKRSSNPVELDEGVELYRILIAAIETRFDESSATIFAYYIQGFSYEEIGQMMDMSKNTVGTKIYRIKQWLSTTNLFD
jgi:RNA polymerase sigma factor (sigma-70 family)